MIKILYIFSILISYCLNVDVAFSTSLAIFSPHISSANKVSTVFKQESVLSNIDIFVFSRFKDFTAAINLNNFNYVISPYSYIQYSDSFKPIYQFKEEDKVNFQYKIVALDKKWASKSMLPEATFAVVQTLSRQNSREYVKKILQLKRLKRVKSVAKPQDVFPILAMGNADIGVFSPKTVQLIKKNFDANLFEIEVFNEEKALVVAALDPKSSSTPDFSLLSMTSLSELGVSGIEKFKE